MGASLRTIDAAERRARLARRHRLATGMRAGDVVEATRSIVCLHATDPATIYLSAWARVGEMSVADLDRALYQDRALVRVMAMRRTLFVVPRDARAAVQAGASDMIAARERRTLIRDVEAAGLRPDGEQWLSQACAEVLAALAGGRVATWSELRNELPVLSGAIRYGEGRSWAGQASVGPRVLTILSAAGLIVRATNAGRWNVSRPAWALADHWLGGPLEPCSEADGVRWLVGAWLRAFGPGTATDLKWWLGSTLTAVRKALAELDAVEVDLGGERGWVLPGDDEPEEPVEPWAALLPPLDPTTMGWFGREWYLGPHKASLFDTAGNAGPTVWCNGRIVGGWRQDETAAVVVQLLEDPGDEAHAAIASEAARLTAWLDGTRVLPRFPSPLWKDSSSVSEA